MKSLLKGNLKDLYERKTVKVRKLETGTYVEYVRKYKYLPERYGDDKRYTIEVCGINENNVPIAGSPAEWDAQKRIFWQFADDEAVKEILANPINAYDWDDVRNGVRATA